MTESSKPNATAVVVKPSDRVTAIVTQRIDPEKTDDFLKWQKEISHATSTYEGYDHTDLFPPVPGIQEEWVTVIHFKSNAHLDHWLHSETRAAFKKQFEEQFGYFELRKVATGLGFWFQGAGAKAAPWKMVLTVVLALYPSVMLLNVVMFPHLTFLPLPARLLVGNLCTVSMLQWLIMPHLTKSLGWWYQPVPSKKLRTDLLGLGLVAFILTGILCLFSLLPM